MDNYNATWHGNFNLLLVSRFCLIGMCCAYIVAMAGCSFDPGYPSTTISGIVTVDGQPVPKGYITFSPAIQGQGPVVGSKISEGKYLCEQVPLGKHQVTFVAQAKEMKAMTEVATGQQHEVPKNLLPPKYRSGVETEVTADSKVLDFPLAAKSS